MTIKVSRKEYYKIKNSAWNEYLKIKDSAWKKYLKTMKKYEVDEK